MNIAELVKELHREDDCSTDAPSGMPAVNFSLPRDVIEFYQRCGGAALFKSSDYSIELVAPHDFVRANPIIALDEGQGDISFDWYIIGKSGEQYITIDTNEERKGRCYDSHWDCHAVSGSCPIIAESFTDLLVNLIDARGENWFWLSDDFRSLGDAYD